MISSELGEQGQVMHGANYYQQVFMPKSLPFWEEKFCRKVGNVPLKNLLNTKKHMHRYHDVLQWDDSAALDALNDAKNRFWEMVDGFPCTIPLPDPDAYIDEIDWSGFSTSTSPELFWDDSGGARGKAVKVDVEFPSDQSTFSDSEEDTNVKIELNYSAMIELDNFEDDSKKKMLQELMMELIFEGAKPKDFE